MTILSILNVKNVINYFGSCFFMVVYDIEKIFTKTNISNQFYIIYMNGSRTIFLAADLQIFFEK